MAEHLHRRDLPAEQTETQKRFHEMVMHARDTLDTLKSEPLGEERYALLRAFIKTPSSFGGTEFSGIYSGHVREAGPEANTLSGLEAALIYWLCDLPEDDIRRLYDKFCNGADDTK